MQRGINDARLCICMQTMFCSSLTNFSIMAHSCLSMSITGLASAGRCLREKGKYPINRQDLERWCGGSACVCVCFHSAAEASVFAGSQDDSEDQSKVIVGVVVGLLIAAALVGLLYWLYMKNSRYEEIKSLSFHLLSLFLYRPHYFCSNSTL